MRLRPALLLAAPAGVLGGHAIGYLAAPGPDGGGAVHHGYLSVALAVAVPFAIMAVAWAATVGAGGIRDVPQPPRPVPLGPLLVAQWVLFTGQEAAEHAVSGHGLTAALHSPALWWGLGAQVVTAGAILVLLRASAATGALLVAVLGSGRPMALRRQPWHPDRPPRRLPPSPVALRSARGPPAVRFA